MNRIINGLTINTYIVKYMIDALGINGINGARIHPVWVIDE